APPAPSESVSVCFKLSTAGQLSKAPQIPSPSTSSFSTSEGQLADAPAQCSTGSQMPTEARQTVDCLLNKLRHVVISVCWTTFQFSSGHKRIIWTVNGFSIAYLFYITRFAAGQQTVPAECTV